MFFDLVKEGIPMIMFAPLGDQVDSLSLPRLGFSIPLMGKSARLLTFNSPRLAFSPSGYLKVTRPILRAISEYMQSKNTQLYGDKCRSTPPGVFYFRAPADMEILNFRPTLRNFRLTLFFKSVRRRRDFCRLKIPRKRAARRRKNSLLKCK